MENRTNTTDVLAGLIELACEDKKATLEDVTLLLQYFDSATKARAIAIFGLHHRRAHEALNYTNIEQYAEEHLGIGRSRYYQLLNFGSALVFLCRDLPIPGIEKSLIRDIQIRALGATWDRDSFIKKMQPLMIHDDIYKNEVILLRSLDELVEKKAKDSKETGSFGLKESYSLEDLAPMARFAMVNQDQKKAYFKTLSNKEKQEIFEDMAVISSGVIEELEDKIAKDAENE